jgi:SNF2 family DNA or RNA helicase
MIKLSVSQAARKLGISRADIQVQINTGKLQTHEGYVTTDSIRLAYPTLFLHSEEDQHLKKIQAIKAEAVRKIGISNAIKVKNEQILSAKIHVLQKELVQTQLKNAHYELVFSQLSERLDILEKCCHNQDKAQLHALQKWVAQH